MHFFFICWCALRSFWRTPEFWSLWRMLASQSWRLERPRFPETIFRWISASHPHKLCLLFSHRISMGFRSAEFRGHSHCLVLQAPVELVVDEGVLKNVWAILFCWNINVLWVLILVQTIPPKDSSWKQWPLHSLHPTERGICFNPVSDKLSFLGGLWLPWNLFSQLSGQSMVTLESLFSKFVFMVTLESLFSKFVFMKRLTQSRRICDIWHLGISWSCSQWLNHGFSRSIHLKNSRGQQRPFKPPWLRN